VFASKTPASCFLSRPARNEWGESWREGYSLRTNLLSPALSSFFEEDREKKGGEENSMDTWK